MMQFDLDSRLSRYRDFFASRQSGKLLIITNPYPLASMRAVEKPPFCHWPLRLTDFDFSSDKDNRRFLNIHIENMERSLRNWWRSIPDDYIPAINAGGSYGVAVHYAFVTDQPLIFQEDTSYLNPVILEWDDLDRLRLDEYNFWFKRQVEATAYLRQACEGLCFVEVVSVGPLDLSNALRGDQLFLDLYDAPDKVHELQDFSTQALIWLDEAKQKAAGDVCGGRAIWGTWVPGNTDFTSSDASDMCSSADHREFERPYLKRIADHFGGLFLHHHSLGRHMHAELAKLPNLHVLEINTDPSEPEPIHQIEAIYEEVAGTPLMIRCSAQDVFRYIDVLRTGQAIIAASVNSREEARVVIDLVRRNSRI